MQLLRSNTTNESVNFSLQKQMRNPIVQGFRSVLSKLLLIKSSVSMLFGDNSLDAVGDLTYGLLDTPSYDLMAQHLKQDPASAALIRDRYIPPAHDLDKLLTLPQDSLGYIYAAKMKKMGFDPNLHKGMVAESDAYYVEMRISQTHDLWHIVTGFDTSFINEIGLQAFYLSQFAYPVGTMLVGNSLMSMTLREPAQLPQLIEAIAQGLQMGKTAKSLFAQKWEEGWEKPLTRWQTELNIQPIQHE
ncbi:Coq4 family protein [Synechococcus elongatus]|uniref:Coq4 family protein n=1 Tax=Synechococcus elongatus TaxID=32046 RepID=UPI0030CD2026